MLSEREAYLWLGSLRTMSSLGKQKLLTIFGDPRELYDLPEELLMQLVSEQVIRPETMEEIHGTRKEIDRKLEEYREKNFPYVTPADPEYPALLLEIPDPPPVLFYRGDLGLLERRPAMAVVGSRTPTLYGNEMVRHFVPPLASAGVVIVSGLAQGIDAEAHRAALSTGKTIGVLGGGVDICYPLRNYRIYEEMCRNHLVLTEYPPGTPPLSIHFPQRNRIISGICEGILVMEARERSGTRITADTALDQGRNVYAIPGRVGDPLSEGTNTLIRMGAMLVRRPEDILEDLGLLIKNKDKRKKDGQTLSKSEKAILSRLSYSPVYVDDLLPSDPAQLQKTFALLLSMEQRGLVRQVMQGYYVKV